MSLESFKSFMRIALEEARVGFEAGEVPVGALVVKDGEVISKAHNQVEDNDDPTGHAEVLAIRRAAEKLGDWRLNYCHLYVTLEPCTMCIGAIRQSRIGALIFGATDDRLGACGSLYDLSEDQRLGPTPRVVRGVLAEECGSILSDFFKSKR